jgi:hypothetical protein
MGAVVEYEPNIIRVGKSDEAESSRPAGLTIFHNNTVDDFAEATKVTVERLCNRNTSQALDFSGRRCQENCYLASSPS